MRSQSDLQLQNTFTEFELTEDEQVSAVQFSDLQIASLQNIMADYAKARLNIHVDPANVASFIQQEAELKGKIELLQYLIDTSNEIKQLIAQQAASTQNH